jgi:hypothetical protein
MGHPHNKQTRGPPTRDLINIAKGADQRTRTVVVAEACIQSDLCTACMPEVVLDWFGRLVVKKSEG